MTTDEMIDLLAHYERCYFTPPDYRWLREHNGKFKVFQRIYERWTVEMLIQTLNETPFDADPFSVLNSSFYQMIEYERMSKTKEIQLRFQIAWKTIDRIHNALLTGHMSDGDEFWEK